MVGAGTPGVQRRDQAEAPATGTTSKWDVLCGVLCGVLSVFFLRKCFPELHLLGFETAEFSVKIVGFCFEILPVFAKLYHDASILPSKVTIKDKISSS